MKLKNTLLIVKDISQSKQFYKQILDLKVLFHYNGYVMLSSGIVLYSYEMWKEKIHRHDEDIVLPHHASTLCFETDDLDHFIVKLDHYNIPLVHPIKEETWRQRVVRFYDPDGHIIEVSESLKKTVKRFLNKGLSYEEVSQLMGIPLDYMKHIK